MKATAAGATGAWVVGRLTGTRGHASTMGLAALISTQLAQTAWAGRRSPLVLGTVAGSLAALVAVVQIPGVSRFFGCRPLDPVSWVHWFGPDPQAPEFGATELPVGPGGGGDGRIGGAGAGLVTGCGPFCGAGGAGVYVRPGCRAPV